VNQLIEFLRRENNFTLQRLREIYRTLCMQTHPDRGKGGDEGFKRLQTEYEGALAELARAQRENWRHTGGSGPGSSTPDPRRIVLERLYVYTVKFYGKESEKLMAELISAAREYDRDFASLLVSYTGEFLSCFHAWESEGPVYYTHCLLIAAVKQMFYWFSMGLPHQRRLFQVCCRTWRHGPGSLRPTAATSSSASRSGCGGRDRRSACPSASCRPPACCRGRR
jgi:hypothetical protein